MKTFVLRLVRNDEGQDLIEYVLIGTLVSVAVVIGATALGTNLNTWYGNMAAWVVGQLRGVTGGVVPGGAGFSGTLNFQEYAHEPRAPPLDR